VTVFTGTFQILLSSNFANDCQRLTTTPCGILIKLSLSGCAVGPFFVGGFQRFRRTAIARTTPTMHSATAARAPQKSGMGWASIGERALCPTEHAIETV